jgi:hypothetical protein
MDWVYFGTGCGSAAGSCEQHTVFLDSVKGCRFFD